MASIQGAGLSKLKKVDATDDADNKPTPPPKVQVTPPQGKPTPPPAMNLADAIKNKSAMVCFIPDIFLKH